MILRQNKKGVFTMKQLKKLDECKEEEDMFKLIDSIISRLVMEPLPKTDESSTEGTSDEFSVEK